MPSPTTWFPRLFLVLSLLCGALALGPSTAHAQVVIRPLTPQASTSPSYSPQASERPRYQAPERRGSHPLWGLFVPAIILWGVSYITTIGVTAAITTRGSDIGINAIPWAGPWVCLAACRRPEPYAWSLILSGTIQAVTTILWIIGAAVQVGGDDGSALLEHEGVRFSPWASADGAGLVVDLDL